jgi:hypothetical protein
MLQWFAKARLSQTITRIREWTRRKKDAFALHSFAFIRVHSWFQSLVHLRLFAFIRGFIFVHSWLIRGRSPFNAS